MKIGFININKYSNISHEIINEDLYCYLSEYFKIVKLEQDFKNLNLWFKKAIEQKIDFIFLNAFANPEFFKYRTINKVDINFILWPYVFTPWAYHYKEIAKYIDKYDVVITFSKFLEQSFKNISKKFHTHYMPIPIDYPSFKSKKLKTKKKLNIIYCGRMIPEKGLDVLLKALALIIKNQNFKLYIISETENNDYQHKEKNLNKKFLKKIKSEIKTNCLSNKVIFCDGFANRQNEKKKILSKGDVLVHLSTDQGETFGRVIIEAFASGLAVISSKWQALDELIVGGKNGFTVKVKDNHKLEAKDVATKLNKLYDSILLKTIQNNNIIKAKEYDYRHHLKKLEKYLKIRLKNKKSKIYKLTLFNTIEIEIQNKCNRLCAYCPNSKFNLPFHEMEEKLFYNIINQLAEIKYEGRIYLHRYNEPLLDKRINKFVKYIKVNCPESFIVIFTNGDYLNKDNLKKLLSNGVGHFIVTNHQHKKNNLHLKNYFKLSKNEIKKITVTDSKQMKKDNRGGLINYKKIDNIYPCYNPAASLIINTYGKAVLCCMDYLSTTVLGDANKEKLLNIWQKKKFKEIRQGLALRNRNIAAICQNCDCNEYYYGFSNNTKIPTKISYRL